MHDYDAPEEFAKLKILLAGVILFLVSIVLSFNETRYLLWGTTTWSNEFKREIVSGGRRSRQLVRVTYTFDDNGKKRKEEDEVGINFQFPPQNAAHIEYIPGSESSRLVGHDQEWAFWVLGGSFVIMGVGAYNFWRWYKS